MMKVAIFGDCHTARVWEHHNFDDSKYTLRMWGRAGTWSYGLDLKEKSLENMDNCSHEQGDPKCSLSSGVEVAGQKIMLSKMNEGWNPKVSFKEVEESDLIMPWIGYIDIRQYLPVHQNADEVAKIVVDKFIKFFPDKKIRFIEPLPQFTEMLLKYEGIHPSYTYEERLEQNKLYIEGLRKYSKEAGFMEPVSQQDIYRVTGRNEFTTDMTHNRAPHPVDGLKDEYHAKIYELFRDEIEKTISYYHLS
jgi:hypothetical protein